ncbi:hypothetical protein GCM10027072_60570 [Streptomyces bullii]
MAGESPDRSKQRESSAQPTSGSAGPVPEARSEAGETGTSREPRDPRLAVAREASASSSASSGSSSSSSAASSSGARGGVDTATRTLSVREVRAEDEQAEDTQADAEEGGLGGGEGSGNADADAAATGDADSSDSSNSSVLSDSSDSSGASGSSGSSGSSGASGAIDASGSSGGGAGATARDGRLREAVAAWARPADGNTGADAAGSGAGDDEGAPGSQAPARGAEDAEDATAAGTAVEGAEVGAGAASTDDSDSQAAPKAGAAVGRAVGTGSDTDAGSGAGADGTATASGDRGDADATADADTDAGAQAVVDAAEPASGADGGSRAAADADAATETSKPASHNEDDADTATDTAKPVSDAEDGSDATADADTDAGAQAVVDTATPASHPKGDADAATDTSKPASAAEDDADTDADAAEPASDTDADSGTAAGAGAASDAAQPAKGAEPLKDGSRAGVDGGAVTDAVSPRPEAGARGADDDGGEAEAAGHDGPEGADGARRQSDTQPVDQPTAVFKAVRPPAPAVDQPTTMLKIGDAAGKAGKSDDKDGAQAAQDAPAAQSAKTESDAERTSKFVALRDLDDPATRRPKPAEATTALPRVAPAESASAVPQVGPERTTQQPLPPKPPLDLLAELTNTPPPPDTPLRTAVRRVKIWTPLVLLLVIVFAVVQSVRPLPTPTLDLTAQDSYTFQGGKVDIPWPAAGQAALDVQGIGTFGSSGEQKPVPIASVAKVMTAYVILRDHPLKSGEDGPKIEIDQAAEDQSDAGQESTVDVTKGDKISQREALESILIASANNVARLLARWDAGSEKAFVAKMNDAAKDLGMKNTTYTDPSGLNNTTVSTAVDQVKLAKAAMQQPAFREVAAMMSYVDYKGVKHDNWNRLVGYNDVVGIKTGTTTSALGNLVFAAKKEVGGETRRIVGAVVRQPAGGPDNTILGAALHEGDKLIGAAQDALKSETILKKGTVVGYADDGLGGRTPVVVTEDVTAVGWAGLTVELTFAADELPHQAKAGAKVGTLTVGDGTNSAVKVPVALQKDLVEPGLADKLTRLG